MMIPHDRRSVKRDLILIVDDEPLNRALLERMLGVLGYETRSAANGREALSAIDEDVDLILLDVNMPDLTGFDVARLIRSAESCSDVPVIMVTALSSMQDRLAAVESGANDFLCKPVDLTELRVRVTSQLNVKHAQDALKKSMDDLEVKVEQRTVALQQANQRLTSLATTDAITGLPNHRSLVATLEVEIARCAANKSCCSVLFIDLDRFKSLNDTFGHSIGDYVLSEFGKLIEKVIKPVGIGGRWGGEEFLCVLPEVDEELAVEFAEQLRQALAQHLFKREPRCRATCSIGVASFPADGRDRSTLAEAADKAMYVAKSLGRNQVRASRDVVSGFEALCEKEASSKVPSLEGLVEALATLVSDRNEVQSRRADDVESLSMRLAKAMNLDNDEVQLVALVGKLHDIGKVAVPDFILQKPGPLSTDEWAEMKLHSTIGAEVISRVPSLRSLAPAIRAHHERWDGNGYPDGIAGEAIPLAARIVSVAEAYAAMTTDRPYRKAGSTDDALMELTSQAGTQFCPEVISALGHLVEQSRKAA